MSMLEEYNQHMARYEELKKGRGFRFDARPGLLYQKPFQIFGNLYYVGDTFVCAHLIDTGDGLILLDAGNWGQGGMLVNAIWEMGFNPKDIRWLIVSHGHVDHLGQVQFFKDMYGCEVYLSEPDARMFREHPERSFIQGSGNPYDVLFTPDVEIHDGEKIRFGNTEITFIMTPGHSDGVLSQFFDVTDGERVLRAGYFGGFGFNTLQKNYLLEIGDPEFKMRDTYLASLAKVRDEHVDIFLGNHPINNDTIGKYRYMVEHPGENPFINDQEWKTYLDQKRDELLRFMADPANN